MTWELVSQPCHLSIFSNISLSTLGKPLSWPRLNLFPVVTLGLVCIDYSVGFLGVTDVALFDAFGFDDYDSEVFARYFIVEF